MPDERPPGKVTALPPRFPSARAAPPGTPAGKLRVVVTYLEMLGPPRQGPSSVSAPVAVLRAEQPTASFYRYLYETVGAPWLWFERRQMSDETLLRRIQAPRIEVSVLYRAGVPAGFVELDRRDPEATEIALFGLVPEFIGCGLGAFFLAWSVNHAWRPPVGPVPERVWLHTCSLDHPNALPSYQRAGFSAFRREEIVIDDPRGRLGL